MRKHDKERVPARTRMASEEKLNFSRSSFFMLSTSCIVPLSLNFWSLYVTPQRSARFPLGGFSSLMENTRETNLLEVLKRKSRQLFKHGRSDSLLLLLPT